MMRRTSTLLAVPTLLLVVAATAAGSSRSTSGRIVFITNRHCVDSRGVENDCGRGEIAVVSSDGSGLTRLTHDSRTEGSPAWSPDRRQIAFFRVPRPRQLGQVWVMNANGQHQRRLTRLQRTAFFGELDWAPSGGSIVFKAFPSSQGGTTELWLANARTGVVSRLTNSSLSKAGPAWSPNGRWIAFFTEGRRQPYRIWRLSVATRHVVRLTRGPAADVNPAWSPDSRRIAFTHAGRLAIMDADGRHLRVLRMFGVDPSWSPDGEWIVFTSDRNLFKVRPDGSGRQQLTHVRPPVVDDQPDW
jgi:TolB protein